jgi:hypothetical protein
MVEALGVGAIIEGIKVRIAVEQQLHWDGDLTDDLEGLCRRAGLTVGSVRACAAGVRRSRLPTP